MPQRRSKYLAGKAKSLQRDVEFQTSFGLAVKVTLTEESLVAEHPETGNPLANPAW